MRRREKFVVSALILTLGLFAVQYVTLEWRYVAVALLSMLSFGISAWALSDDLQPFEWLTIVPVPALYTAAVGLFYFLLPSNIISRAVILGLFCVGMYALYLTANIYSVAKGRTIQLLHAAHAIGLLFTLLMSLLFTNTLFSLRLPWYLNGLVVAAIHFPLCFLSLWSVELEPKIRPDLLKISGVFTVLLTELAIILSFMPFSVWNTALFIMAFLYIGLGVLQSFFKGRLFSSTVTEYSLVAGFIMVLFFLLFPLK